MFYSLVVTACLQFMFLCSRDYTEFLEELEEDPEMRKNVNIFKGNCACVLSSIYRSKMSRH